MGCVDISASIVKYVAKGNVLMLHLIKELVVGVIRVQEASISTDSVGQTINSHIGL